LGVASAHAYAITVIDDQWASDIWSGVILASETAKSAEVALNVTAAVPLTVRVTSGPARSPVVNAMVGINTPHRFRWRDASGEMKGAYANLQGSWLRTDANGLATSGVGKGEREIRVYAGQWSERKTLQITTDAPISVDFYREAAADRKLAGRLIQDGKPFQPSATTLVKVWSNDSGSQPELRPQVKADGTIEFTSDAKELSVLVSDAERRLGGFKRLMPSGGVFDLEMWRRLPVTAGSWSTRTARRPAGCGCGSK
jgi:hypothetical protein